MSDNSDPELDAMRAIVNALASLDSDARRRVLRWAEAKFGCLTEVAGGSGAPSDPVAVDNDDLAVLYAACQPHTDTEKTLVVAFWLQEVRRTGGVDAQSVNAQLKDLGHGVSNITRAFDKLIQQRPQLIIQTRKSGSTQQARKTFRVTREGKLLVDQLRQGTSSRAGPDPTRGW